MFGLIVLVNETFLWAVYCGKVNVERIQNKKFVYPAHCLAKTYVCMMDSIDAIYRMETNVCVCYALTATQNEIC